MQCLLWPFYACKQENHPATRDTHQFRLMRRLSWILPRQVLSAFYYAYLVPSFNYCSLVWRVCQVFDARKLQCLQNFAACIILKLPKSSSVNNARNTLNWKSLEEYRNERLLNLAKCIIHPDHDKHPLPQYLFNLITMSSATHNYHTRGASSNRLTLSILSSHH